MIHELCVCVCAWFEFELSVNCQQSLPPFCLSLSLSLYLFYKSKIKNHLVCSVPLSHHFVRLSAFCPNFDVKVTVQVVKERENSGKMRFAHNMIARFNDFMLQFVF